MSVKARMFARIEAEQSTGDAAWSPTTQAVMALVAGTGIGQVDRVYSREHAIASGAALDLDLAGSLTDGLGNVVAFAELVGVLIINRGEDGSVNSTDVTVGGGTNPFDGFWGTAGDQVVLPPGGFLMVGADGAAGIGAVVAATGDILRIANASGAVAKVQVMILGRSA